MNYEEARVYLDEMSKYGSVLGLESMKVLLNRLDNPQDELKFIHISGTNGKGSVSAYLSTILKKAGYCTGRYSSPTLFSYRERIQVNDENIERDSLARHITKISHVVENLRREKKPTPTVFEIETALAFLYFKEKKCDIVVLETGMGGTLDATNVVKTTILEVITPIGMDHMNELGNTLSQIARQKAGIIKNNTRVVTALQKKEVREVLEQVCAERKCVLHEVDPSCLREICYGWDSQSFSYKDWEKIRISLAGKFQIQNAALALEAVEQLREEGFLLSEQVIYDGMLHTTWKGRFTVLSREPVILLDGAHNPQAAEALRDSLELYFGDRKKYYIFGVFKDKDYHKIIEITAPLAEHIVTVETPNNPRALSAEQLKQDVEAVNPSVEASENMEQAVMNSLKLMDRDDVLVIFGSLSFLQLAEKVVEERGRDK